jgi:hypothetical protein
VPCLSSCLKAGTNERMKKMATYYVTVRVDFSYEVEADSEELAEAEGWKYEEHLYSGEVYSIDVEEKEEEEEEN